MIVKWSHEFLNIGTSDFYDWCDTCLQYRPRSIMPPASYHKGALERALDPDYPDFEFQSEADAALFILTFYNKPYDMGKNESLAKTLCLGHHLRWYL